MRRFSAMASTLFAMAACGDDGARHTPDAARQPDGAMADAPNAPTTVNITTLARSFETVPAGTPHAGVTVFAVDPAGALAGMATTDADGKATVPLASGGSVTVVYPADANDGTFLVTYAGVKPGDSLTFGDRTTAYAATTGQTGTMTISWAPVTNATSYRITSPCYAGYGITATSVSVDLSAACQTDTATVGLVAYDASNNVLASVVIPAATYTPGSTLAIAANQWVSQTAAADYTIMLTGVDAAASSADIGGYDELVHDELGRFWFNTPPQFQTATPANGIATASVSLASLAPHPSAAAKLYHSTHAGRQWFFKPGTSPVAIDTSTLPWIDTLTVDTAARTVAWTQTTGTYDAMRLNLSYGTYHWTVVLPPGVTQLDASAAPAELAPYLPNATDGFSLVGCELVDLASSASYDALRALPEWRTTTTELAVRAGDEPSASLADCGEGYHF